MTDIKFKNESENKMIKKTLGTVLVVAAVLCLAPLALSYDGGTGITGTPHDMSSPAGLYYGGDNQQRICIYCHAPHNAYRLSKANGGPDSGVGAGPQATDAFDYLPLWNHTLQADTAYSMYYAGPGAPATGATAQQTLNAQIPGSVSLLCLSCHDGSVAVNAYGNPSQPLSSQGNGNLGNPVPIRTQYQIGAGKYLGNHHPIGFDYDAVQGSGAGKDDGLKPSASTLMYGTKYIKDHLYSSGATGKTTVMECGTCHSVHNTNNDPTGQALLWKSDFQSGLCLTCHIK